MTADRAAVPAKNDHRAVTTDVGTKTQMTAGLGSAVTPPVAEWITRRCLAALGVPEPPSRRHEHRSRGECRRWRRPDDGEGL